MLDIKIKKITILSSTNRKEKNLLTKDLLCKKKNDIKKNSQGQRKVPRPECWIYIK